MNIIFHADDFGYNKEVSKDILDCYYNGTLHGISIMPNSTYFEECMEMLNDNLDEKSASLLLKTIHFSISEGPCVADKNDIPLLVNEDGMFKLSFFKLLLMSIGPKKRELKKQLKIELTAQYEKSLPYLDEINIDSHVHYHMIPLVFNTLMEIIEESGRKIGYVRVPAEPIMPFVKSVKLYSSYDLVNIVKNVVLNVLAFLNKKSIKRYKDKTAVFYGIVMSGHMDIDRVKVLLPHFVKVAEKKGMDLEVLAHPGHATSVETVLDPNNADYAKAPLSENRLVEKQMFMEIGKYL